MGLFLLTVWSCAVALSACSGRRLGDGLSVPGAWFSRLAKQKHQMCNAQYILCGLEATRCVGLCTGQPARSIALEPFSCSCIAPK